jgi:DNA replication and repair protein RecF
MILDQLQLTNFRSYKKQAFTFSPSVTIIVGDNTTGKTNIIESMYLLATGKSFRTEADREMIQWDKEVSMVHCRLSDGNDQMKLQVILTAGVVAGRKTQVKKYIVNGVSRRMIDFVGNVRTVLFWPEHMELVTDSPSIRRRYLDSVLVQVDREYRRNLLSYERGLRQRNRLLDRINEGNAHRHQLIFWNQLLIKAGTYLTDKRAEYIDYINSYQISLRQDSGRAAINYQIQYDKSVISEARLAQYSEEEVAAKATLIGPHRDDFIFQTGKKRLSLSSYGSRGEQRLAILWLKLAEVAYIEGQTGERPILLLDDIFSELDEEHRAFVLDILGKQQTVITTAEGEIPAMLKQKNKTTVIIAL